MHLKKVLFLALLSVPVQIFAQVINPGNFIGPVPPKTVDLVGHSFSTKGTASENVISGVPAYIWFRGCGPTSIGMIFGYYDTHGFPDMLPGDGSVQTDAINQVIASDEHYSDYILPEDDASTGILPDKSELPVGDEHANNSIADYLRTSQSIRGNLYAWTLPADVKSGWENCISGQLPDYEGTCNAYNIDDFPFDSLKANIDRNRPMMFLVDSDADGVYDHFVCVIGYGSDATGDYYNCLDTWDTDQNHWYLFQSMAPGRSFGVLNCFTFEVHLKLPAAAGTISGPDNVCPGQSGVEYSVPAIAGATSYVWTLPSGVTGSSSTNSISVDFGESAVSGDITVKGHNDNGDGEPSSLAVVITDPLPDPGAITGPTSVCQGTQETYSIDPIAGALSYSWTIPSGWSGTSTSSSINVTPGSTGGTISVYAVNDCGNSNSGSINVSVSTVPSRPGSISGDATVCQATQQVYSVAPVSGATSYTWTLPAGWSGSSTSESINVTVGSSGGNILVTANNSCGSGSPRSLTVYVSQLVNQPGLIAGATTTCQGVEQLYSISPVSGATSYTWTLPSGWSGSSSTETITTTTGLSGGTISVLASNICGSGDPRTLGVSVVAPPVRPGTISGLTSICQGSTHTYSITPVDGADSYIWNLPDGWSGSSTSESITAVAGSTGGIISVQASNSCGTSSSRSVSITVNTAPAQPGNISGANYVCEETDELYSVSPVAGATSYTWNLPSGWSGNSSSSFISVTPGPNGGQIYVTANNTCGTSTPRSITVYSTALPGQAGSITGLTTVCQGQTSVTYSIPSIPGANSYNWTLPSGVTGSSNSNSITVDFGSSAASGNISVYGINSCGSGNQSDVFINVNETPPTPIITLNDNVLHSSSFTGNQWYMTSGAIAGATYQDYTPILQDDYYVIVSSGGCSSEKSNSIYIILTGMEPAYIETPVKIYPNPVKDELIIEKPGNITDLKYEILNSLGQIVRQGILVNKTVVNTESFSKGIYILKIENGRTFDFIKIIKE